MPAPVSIIIPALNAAQDLPLCLASLMPGLSADLVREVILVDGGSEDATPAIAEDTGATVLRADRPGRAHQLRLGAAAARGDWMLFLHADTALTPDWAERVWDHLDDHTDRAASFTLAFRSNHPMARRVAARANLRARWLGLPYGDQGLLISRGLYEAVGGYADIRFMEDVQLVRAIGRSRLVQLSAQARTSAVKYEQEGWRRRSWRNAWLILRVLLGADPETLMRPQP
jgi:rSAM/selenodomain-associated transferase 2